MKGLFVELVTPAGIVFEGEANAVQLPGVLGSFQILLNHAPLISALGKGLVKIDLEKESKTFQITDGIVEVLDNKVAILVESVSE